MTRTMWLGGASLAALLTAAPAAAQEQHGKVTVLPYVEIGQTLDADLNNDGDVVTYTSLAAGVDAGVSTARVDGQASLRYEHRFAYDRYSGDEDIVDGLARIDARIAPGLSLDAGALATRTREDIRGAAPGLLTGNDANISQVYSLYAGPSLATHAGDLSITGQYQIGYTKAETPTYSSVGTGQPRLDYFDHSLGQSAVVSVGVSPNAVAPFGVTASAGWDREDASQLDQRFEDLYGRVDALVPIAPTVALAGGVGYEKLTTSQRDPVVDATGTAVLDADGRFETNEASPRRIAYRTEGVLFDAGVVWRPNRRTSLGAYVGRRYGSTSYTGNLTYQASKSVGLSVNVYDSVQTFGSQLRQGLSALPTSFIAARDAYSQQFNGCVFSTSGSTPGGCLNDVFQSITTASFRARGIDGVLSVNRGQNTFGVGAGYANRELFAPYSPAGITLYGLNDQSWYAQGFWARQLSPVSGVNANLFFDYYDPAVAGAEDTYSVGATASYYHNFGRLGTTASVGLYDFKSGNLRDQLSAQALLAARYTF